MSSELNEQLSALVDDELQEGESALLLRQIARSEELRARFGRYCLISEALQRNLSVAADSDLTERVACALEDEPSYGVEQRQRSRAGLLLRPVAGVALAVVGAMAILALWPQSAREMARRPGQPIVAMQEVVAGRLQPMGVTEMLTLETSDAVFEMASSQHQWERLDPQVRQQLTVYLIDHSERSAIDRLETAQRLPYKRVVGHDINE